MLEERVQRTHAARRNVRGRPSETKTSPRSAQRGPAPLTAPRSWGHSRSAAQVRAEGPPGSPPAAAAGTRHRAVSLPIWKTRASGQSGRARRGRRRAAGADAPPGSAGTPRGSPSSSSFPPPRPVLPQVLPSPPHPRSASPQPAQRSPRTGRRGPPEPPPPPGLGPSRQPPPHVPRVAIAFAATLASPPPLWPPPPSPQSPAEAKAAPAAARTRGEAPAHYAPRWGRGRPAAAWERGARGTWRSGGRGRPRARRRWRERLTFRGLGRARSRAARDATQARRV